MKKGIENLQHNDGLQIHKGKPEEKRSYSASKMIEGKHEVLIVWNGWNQKSMGRVVNNGYTTVIYMDEPYPLEIPNWTPIDQPPKGEKSQRMVLVRRTSDEILMGRWTGEKWIVYFNDTRGVQTDELIELKHDPIVDWQELPQPPSLSQ